MPDSSLISLDAYERIDLDYALCKGIKFCKEMVDSDPYDPERDRHYTLQRERLEKLRIRINKE